MQTILVPIDFTKESKDAITYAAELNKEIGANILLFHTYKVPLPVSDLPVMIEESEIRKNVEYTMKRLVKRYSAMYPEMKFISEIEEGYPETRVAELEKKISCELAVMGSKKGSALETFLLGSHTPKIMRRSTSPILVIPPGEYFRKLNKIVFAANYNENDFKNVYQLTELAKFFSAEIILMHVADGSLDTTYEFDRIEKFERQIAELTGYPKISFKLMEDKNVAEGLSSYVEEINADMLAVSMRNRNFIQRIFDRGISNRMVQHFHLPLMVFHSNF